MMNSFIHAYPENPGGTIDISFHLDKKGIKFTYTDDGAGIPPEVLPKIFDPFFTTNRGSGGSGLGLNIVYNLVTGKLQGKIKCESTYGKGTTFSFFIPLKEITGGEVS